jgi:hypothetical protein
VHTGTVLPPLCVAPPAVPADKLFRPPAITLWSVGLARQWLNLGRLLSRAWVQCHRVLHLGLSLVAVTVGTKRYSLWWFSDVSADSLQSLLWKRSLLHPQPDQGLSHKRGPTQGTATSSPPHAGLLSTRRARTPLHVQVLSILSPGAEISNHGETKVLWNAVTILQTSGGAVRILQMTGRRLWS